MSLDSDAGIVPCDCSSESSPCFGLSADARVLPLQWPKSSNELSSKLDHAAASSMLLATHCTTSSPVVVVSDTHLLLPPSMHASLLHDPYTPESMETPSSSPSPSVMPQFDFTVGYERESDTYLSMYGSTLSTKDKIYSWDFEMDSVEHSDGPDEDECADDKNGCSNCKRDKNRKNMRPDIQERQHSDSGPKNETVMLTEKLTSGRMVFIASGMDTTSVGNTDFVHTSCVYSEDEVMGWDLNKTKQFKAPGGFEEKCDCGSSLNEFPLPYNMSGKSAELEKVSVSNGVCCCDTVVQNINNNNNNNNNNNDDDYTNKFRDQLSTAEGRDTDQLMLFHGAATVQNTSQVKDNKMSVIIPGLLSEAQDLCCDHNDADEQGLGQNIHAVLLETEHVEVEQNVAVLCSGCSAVSNSAVLSVQAAVNVRSYSDRRPPDSSNEMQSCTSYCNKSALLPHPVSHKTSCPVSNPVISTGNQITNESDSSNNIKFVLPIKNSLFLSEPTESVESHNLNACAKCREHTSEFRLSSCDRVLELSGLLLLDSAVSKLRNDKTTTLVSPVKRLFRSSSVPVSICSTRIMEKHIPYLLVMSRIHSCGDITTSYSIQDAFSAVGGEKSALNQQPCTEQNMSISSAHSSSSKVPVSYNQEQKDDQKLTDRQCFSCCILL